MTVGTTGDSPKSEYQVNSFEAGDLYIYNHEYSMSGLSKKFQDHLKNVIGKLIVK